MKRLVLFVVFAFVMASPLLRAQSLTENFSYSDGAVLTSNNWTQIGTVATNPIAVGTSNGLTYSGYLGSGIGNAAIMTNTGQDIYRGFTTASSGSIYASFLVNFSAVQTGDYFFAFMAGTTTFGGRVYAKANGTNVQFGLSKSTETTTYSTNNYALSTTYLVTLKYTIVSGSSNDQCALFVSTSGVPTTEPSAEISITPTNADPSTNYYNVILRQGGSGTAPSLTIDGIRVGTSWNEAPFPVELSLFTHQVGDNEVILNWETATELNNYGFEVQRSTDNAAWKKIGFVLGSGNSNSPKAYRFTDRTPVTGTSYYRLRQIDNNGVFTYYGALEATLATPDHFALHQNHPNPFNPSTVIAYSIPEKQMVSIKVFNVIGKQVATLVNGITEAGNHEVSFNAAGLPSGTYFYTIETPSFRSVKKMILLR